MSHFVNSSGRIRSLERNERGRQVRDGDAMAYDFRVASDLTTQPKYLLIRAALGDASLWAILSLWGFATEHRPDGNLRGLSDEAIELAANWKGEPGRFVAACLSKQTKLLDGRSGCRKIHDWKDHNPYVAARESRIKGGKKGGSVAASHMTEFERVSRAKLANSFRKSSKVPSKVPSKVLSNSHPIPSHIRGQGSKEPLPCVTDTGMHTCTREGLVEAPAAVCEERGTEQAATAPTPEMEVWTPREVLKPVRPLPPPLPDQDRAQELFSRLRQSALMSPMFSGMSVVGIDGDKLVVHTSSTEDAVSFVRQYKGFTLDVHEHLSAGDGVTQLEVR